MFVCANNNISDTKIELHSMRRCQNTPRQRNRVKRHPRGTDTATRFFVTTKSGEENKQPAGGWRGKVWVCFCLIFGYTLYRLARRPHPAGYHINCYYHYSSHCLTVVVCFFQVFAASYALIYLSL